MRPSLWFKAGQVLGVLGFGLAKFLRSSGDGNHNVLQGSVQLEVFAAAHDAEVISLIPMVTSRMSTDTA